MTGGTTLDAPMCALCASSAPPGKRLCATHQKDFDGWRAERAKAPQAIATAAEAG